jgi:hypothetical protein
MTHEEVIELLPWYANRSLDPAEQHAVAAHLESCAPCARELTQYRTIQAAVAESAEEVPAPAQDLLRRAMGEIQQFEQQKAITAQKKSVSWFTESLAWLGDALFGWIGPAPVLARALVAGQFLIVLALAGGLGLSFYRSDSHVTLSGSGGEVKDGTILAMRFNESISESQLRQTLAAIEGTIVGGPSALGIYRVRVPLTAQQSQELEKVLQSLRANGQVVTYVEKSD